MTIKYGYFKQPLFLGELAPITNDLIVNTLAQTD